jgi:hypothetical protein
MSAATQLDGLLQVNHLKKYLRTPQFIAAQRVHSLSDRKKDITSIKQASKRSVNSQNALEANQQY